MGNVGVGDLMILILTEPNDPHVDHVSQMLAQRGADFIRFNPADFPVRANLSVRYDSGGQIQSSLDRLVPGHWEVTCCSGAEQSDCDPCRTKNTLRDAGEGLQQRYGDRHQCILNTPGSCHRNSVRR
jgi:hypothetical protein